MPETDQRSDIPFTSINQHFDSNGPTAWYTNVALTIFATASYPTENMSDRAFPALLPSSLSESHDHSQERVHLLRNDARYRLRAINNEPVADSAGAIRDLAAICYLLLEIGVRQDEVCYTSGQMLSLSK